MGAVTRLATTGPGLQIIFCSSLPLKEPKDETGKLYFVPP